MPTSVRLPEEIEQRLDFLARQTGRTKAYYIRELIIGHLDALEDYYLAAEVVERIRKARERTFTADDVRRYLGLGD